MVTPFRACGRTATISLTAEEESCVRLGRVDLPIAENILSKLRWSLEVSDIMRRPAPEPRPQTGAGARVSLEDLDL